MSTGATIPGMTPKVLVLNWKCRVCGHKWPIADEDREPRQCPNRDCRAMDWNRPKIKEGRPRKGGKRRAKKASVRRNYGLDK